MTENSERGRLALDFSNTMHQYVEAIEASVAYTGELGERFKGRKTITPAERRQIETELGRVGNRVERAKEIVDDLIPLLAKHGIDPDCWRRCKIPN